MKPTRDGELAPTRRDLVTMLGATAIATPVMAQVPTPATPAAASPLPQDDVRKTSDQLSQIEVPMSLEPAFKFSA